MKEQIGDELVKVEIVCHEEMETSNACQVNSLCLKNQCRQECDTVDYQQIFCDGWYAEHLFIYNLLIDNLRFA